MNLIVRPAAAADMEEAFVWYERQRTGLGDEFLISVQSALNNAAAHPTRYPVIHRDTRRALVRRFPYAIYYRVYPRSCCSSGLYAWTPGSKAVEIP